MLTDLARYHHLAKCTSDGCNPIGIHKSANSSFPSFYNNALSSKSSFPNPLSVSVGRSFIPS